MFQLRDKTGNPVKMKNGRPFEYSTKSLAFLAKRILEADRKDSFTVVEK